MVPLYRSKRLTCGYQTPPEVSCVLTKLGPHLLHHGTTPTASFPPTGSAAAPACTPRPIPSSPHTVAWASPSAATYAPSLGMPRYLSSRRLTSVFLETLSARRLQILWHQKEGHRLLPPPTPTSMSTASVTRWCITYWRYGNPPVDSTVSPGCKPLSTSRIFARFLVLFLPPATVCVCCAVHIVRGVDARHGGQRTTIRLGRTAPARRERLQQLRQRRLWACPPQKST